MLEIGPRLRMKKELTQSQWSYDQIVQMWFVNFFSVYFFYSIMNIGLKNT